MWRSDDLRWRSEKLSYNLFSITTNDGLVSPHLDQLNVRGKDHDRVVGAAQPGSRRPRESLEMLGADVTRVNAALLELNAVVATPRRARPSIA
jgi:hypothetical protein